jgi:CRP-like cAMP-binding protein
LQPKDYIRGQEIVKEDDQTDKVFIVKTGEFAVLKSTDRFPIDKNTLKDEKEKLTLQKILDI